MSATRSSPSASPSVCLLPYAVSSPRIPPILMRPRCCAYRLAKPRVTPHMMGLLRTHRRGGSATVSAVVSGKTVTQTIAVKIF
jgi:hypothetical protein